MAANVENSTSPSKQRTTSLMSSRTSDENHSVATKDSKQLRALPRDESSGLISSLMTAAHNAANLMKPKHGASHESLSQARDVDTNKMNVKSLSLAPRLTQNLELSFRESPLPTRTNSTSSLSPSNVHFESIHKSPISTLGTGDLSLVHFDRRTPARKKISDGAEVHVKGGPFTTESNTNKLLVSGTLDSKIVKRKSISNGSIADSVSSEGTIDTDGADNHSFNPNEFSTLELDQFLDSPQKLHVHPKKDKEFHNTFKKIPASEHLLADFSCALSRDILVQGKMYLSPHYICFNSNILGWVTNLVIPIQEVIQIEKKSTAVLFPNGMVVRTLHQKFVFATFLSRDTTFSIITRVWHNALQDEAAEKNPRQKRALLKRKSASRRSTGAGIAEFVNEGFSDDSKSGSDDDESMLRSGDDNDLTFLSKTSEKEKGQKPKRAKSRRIFSELDSASDEETGSIDTTSNDLPPLSEKNSSKTFKGYVNPGPLTHSPTSFEHEKVDGEVEILNQNFSAPLGVVYNMLYGPDNSVFVRTLEEGKNFDISKERITELNPLHKEREYSYTKPLGGPIGPKQTKCNIVETLLNHDLSNYCELEQVTRTPDVPLGNSFKVKTRLYFSWGPKNTTNLTVFTSIEWSAKSWIKLAIEKGSLDGQKSSMKILTDTLTDLIKNGGSASVKRKTRRSKSAPQPVKAVDLPQKEPEPDTLLEQILKLVERIGLFIPIQIPMMSNTATGGFVLLLGSLLYTYILTFFIRDTARSGRRLTSNLAFTSDGKYVLMPSQDFYLSNEHMRRNSEAQIWDWIAKRTGVDNPDSRRAQAINEKYLDEDFKEMMRVTKERMDAVYSNML